jgi:hypothetical protein
VEILMSNLRQFVILIIVAGCTTQPGKDHGADKLNAAGADVQCHSEQLTGSMISKTVCTTKAERDAQHAAAADLRSAATAHAGGGCPPGNSAQGCQ